MNAITQSCDDMPSWQFQSEKLTQALVDHLILSVGKDPLTATNRDWFFALASVVRTRLIERWMDSMRHYYATDAKRVYYFSLEFLIGRSLNNSILNIGFEEEMRQACISAGVSLDVIKEMESDAALGNGGLGRLAACFLDSMATLSIPGYGMGIRYEYGMFHQKIEHGWQVEYPDNWLRYGNPWEFARPEVLYPVKFYGRVVQYHNEFGKFRSHWVDTDEVMAMAYDTPIPGFGLKTVNNMRLWSAKASREFDLQHFNEGNYLQSVSDKNESENLSKVLYPNDSTLMGRELRLKQQYFFVSASLQDILSRFLKHHESFDQLPDKVAIQLNDTHPAIAIPELMRILVDNHHLDWDHAWGLCQAIFAYTNHTLMPEALETWPVSLLETVLPRHMQIIYEINYRFLQEVRHRYPGDLLKQQKMSLIEEAPDRRVRMAYLAIVGSHKVNGVAQLHTELLQSTIFADFAEFYPDKFINITNGITPRLWLNHANRGLAGLISEQLGPCWITHLNELCRLNQLADNPAFQQAFATIKLDNKKRLADYIKQTLHIEVNPHSLFDVQIKRIHEYKRQLLNVLHVITLYNRIRANPELPVVPRTVIFAGKAAPSYRFAKLIIKLINSVADTVNNDPAINNLLKVVFIPNYDVSTACRIIPAADLSQQISTAGTEASGTGNMKLALNGALTIGTLDGANIEILQAVGSENMFIFGHTAQQIQELKQAGYHPQEHYHNNAELKKALDMINNGFFSNNKVNLFSPLVDSLLNEDRFMLLADYAAYINCQQQVDTLFRDPQRWTAAAIRNVANMGHFSSDRTIQQYAEEIWNIHPL